MKSIEERAEEYASQYCDSDCALCDDICGRLRSGRSFIAGAESEREELLRWRDPEKELPAEGEYVLIKLITGKCEVGVYIENLNWRGADGIVDDYIIGWRPIIEL